VCWNSGDCLGESSESLKCLQTQPDRPNVSFCGGLSPGTFRISLAPRWGTLSQHEMPTPKSCAILCSEVSFCVGCSCCCSSLGESSRPATISLTRQPATQKRRRVGQMRSPQFAHFVYTCFPAVFTRLLALP